MISAIFLAIVKLLLPVGLTAYLLVGFLRDSGRLDAFTDRKELGQKLKTFRKDGRKKEQKEDNYALKKWLKFGCGFYGTTAFYTYAYIEIGTIAAFLLKMSDPANWTFNLTIDLIVGLFVSSIVNFFKAITWFGFWGLGGENYLPVALIAALAGYRIGVHFANAHADEGIGHVALWRWLEKQKSGEHLAREDEPQPQENAE